MPTLFESMWQGAIPALPVYKDDERGVMAIVANPQETFGQLVIFPRRPVPTFEDLTYAEEDDMMLVTRALARHMRAQLPGVERVIRHIEGYGVPDHAHAVLLPSYARGDSDKLHHPRPRQPIQELAAAQEQLLLPDTMIEAELALRQLHMKALLEDAT